LKSNAPSLSHGTDVDIDDDGDSQRGYGDYGGSDDEVINMTIMNGMPMILFSTTTGQLLSQEAQWSV
jgi:hypothetical protein